VGWVFIMKRLLKVLLLLMIINNLSSRDVLYPKPYNMGMERDTVADIEDMIEEEGEIEDVFVNYVINNDEINRDVDFERQQRKEAEKLRKQKILKLCVLVLLIPLFVALLCMPNPIKPSLNKF